MLLCDEPTGALDAATGRLVLEVLRRVNRELGTSLAVVTHNAPIAPDGRSRGDARRREDASDVANASPSAVARCRGEEPHAKLARDLWRLRAQCFTIALLVGVASPRTSTKSVLRRGNPPGFQGRQTGSCIQ